MQSSAINPGLLSLANFGAYRVIARPPIVTLNENPTSPKWVQVYSKSEDAFFADFAKAFQKLGELGFKQ